MRSIAGGIDGLEAVFDDVSLVADAGLLLAGTVMQRLGLESLIDETVRPAGLGGLGVGPQGVDFGGVDAGGRLLYRRRRPSGGGGVAGGAAVSSDGTLDCGVVCAVVHVRACAPARQGGRAGAGAGVVCWRRAQRRGDDRGFGLHGVRGLRQSQARRPRTATPRCWAITRWWRCDQTPARCCTLGCGRDRRSAATSASLVRPWPGCGAWRRALWSRCAPMRGSSPMT